MLRKCYECDWKSKHTACITVTREQGEKEIRFKAKDWICLDCWLRLDYASFLREDSIIKMWGYVP